MSERATATLSSARTAGLMVLFTIAFTAPMAATFSLTRPAIEASTQEGRLRLINEVLPAASYDNALLDDYVTLGPTAELGLEQGGRVYRARRAGAPAGLVLEAAASDGYAGRIQLVVAIASDGTLAGVRVVAHKETPGLGDYIDPRRDRNKLKPWIGQFAGISLADLGADKWKLTKDGGAFAYRTGATISARAVTNATRRAVEFGNAHRAALFSAPSGTAL